MGAEADAEQLHERSGAMHGGTPVGSSVHVFGQTPSTGPASTPAASWG